MSIITRVVAKSDIKFKVSTDLFDDNPNNPVLLVKVNPRDVVAVPDNEEKLRTCRYEVVGYYERDLDHLIDTGNGVPYAEPVDDDDDDVLEGDAAPLYPDDDNGQTLPGRPAEDDDEEDEDEDEDEDQHHDDTRERRY